MIKNAAMNVKREIATAMSQDKALKEYVRDIRNSLSNYLTLPKFPANSNDYFKDICAGIICEYGKISAKNEPNEKRRGHFMAWEILGGKILEGEKKEEAVNYIRKILN